MLAEAQARISENLTGLKLFKRIFSIISSNVKICQEDPRTIQAFNQKFAELKMYYLRLFNI